MHVPGSAFRRLSVPFAFVLVAALRLLTLAPDPWEWDEVLFTNAVRDGIDVRVNRPHPPGYPAYVFAGRVVHALGVEPFRAASLVAAAGSVISSLALFALLRVLGVASPFALTGAVAYALVPAVWIHGVRPLSDAPATAAFLGATTFLVRAIRDGRSRDLILAGALTAVAAGIRPQVGLALAPPALAGAIVVLRRTRRLAGSALALCAALGVSAAFWIPAIRSSGGLVPWSAAVEVQSEFFRSFDLPRGSDFLRPEFWRRWFLEPFGEPWFGALFLAAGLSAFFVSRRNAIALFALFVPILATTVSLLAVGTAPRYALPMLAFPCAMLAVALEGIARRVPGSGIAPAFAAASLAGLAVIGVPPILELHENASPSVAAMIALRDDPRWTGRPIFLDPALEVHAAAILPKRNWRLVRSGEPLRLPADGILVWQGSVPFGLEPDARFALASADVLQRLSRGRYLSTSLHDGRTGASYHLPHVSAPGWWDVDRNVGILPEGAEFSVTSGEGEVRVSFAAQAERAKTTLVVVTSEGRFVRELGRGRNVLEFASVAGPSRRLISIRTEAGRARLSSFRLRAAERPGEAEFRRDDEIPASVDEPGAMAKVRAPVQVSGWCQEWGGGRVDPVEFLVDGVAVPDVPVRRVARPDVAAVLPRMGDCSQAGYVALIPASSVSPGRHALTVVFRAGDRQRTYPPRVIDVSR